GARVIGLFQNGFQGSPFLLIIIWIRRYLHLYIFSYLKPKYLFIMKYAFILFFISSFTLLTACSQVDKDNNASGDSTTQQLAEHVPILASDSVGGRAPGTLGGEKTVSYIAQQFKEAGIAPGNHGSWYQKVPLVSITLQPQTPVTFKGL